MPSMPADRPKALRLAPGHPTGVTRYCPPLSRQVRALAAATAVTLLATFAEPASAQSVRLLVQSSPLAGFLYHDAPQAFERMRVGDVLELVREPANPHDASAIAVAWNGRKLGYVPRRQNDAVAWALDRGEPVTARISRLQEHRNPRLRVEFEVFVD
jgi:hypothetical protein